MRPFIITGCGRSGTMGMAQALDALGVRTSFEEFFTTSRDPPERGFTGWLTRTGTAGEVSSLAAPFLLGRETDAAVIHQVRNPLGVIRSLVGSQTWIEKAMWPNTKFARRWSGINPMDDAVTQSMTYWLEWNQMVEDAGPLARYRVEDVCAELMADIFVRLGGNRSADAIRSRFEQTYSRTANAGPRAAVDWQSIPETALKERVRKKAQQYGYTEEELCR